MRRKSLQGTALALCALALGCSSTTPDNSQAADVGIESRDKQPVELGAVRWERDYAFARKRAESSGRDILVLFQEVPG